MHAYTCVQKIFSSKGHRPVVITEWKDTDRRAYGDLMEALSYGDIPTGFWLMLMRESMAAIAGAKWETPYPVGHWDRLQSILEPERQEEDVDLSGLVEDQVWRNMVSERHTLDAAVLMGETMRVLRLAKSFPLHSLTKLWDQQSRRIVKGEEVLDVVPRVAAAQHKAAARPLLKKEVEEYHPPAVGSRPAATYGTVPAARKVQIMRESKRRILQGVCYFGTSYKKEPIQGAQVLHEAQDWTADQPVDGLAWPGKACSDSTSRYVLHNLLVLLKYLD